MQAQAVNMAGSLKKTFIMLSKFAACLVLGVLLAGCDEAQEKDREREQYCYMTELWQLQASAGVMPKDRQGWPPYDGVCK